MYLIVINFGVVGLLRNGQTKVYYTSVYVNIEVVINLWINNASNSPNNITSSDRVTDNNKLKRVIHADVHTYTHAEGNRLQPI